MLKEVKVDLGFGREEYVFVAEDATKTEINAICVEKFGEPLFKIVYQAPMEQTKGPREY